MEDEDDTAAETPSASAATASSSSAAAASAVPSASSALLATDAIAAAAAAASGLAPAAASSPAHASVPIPVLPPIDGPLSPLPPPPAYLLSPELMQFMPPLYSQGYGSAGPLLSSFAAVRSPEQLQSNPALVPALHAEIARLNALLTQFDGAAAAAPTEAAARPAPGSGSKRGLDESAAGDSASKRCRSGAAAAAAAASSAASARAAVAASSTSLPPLVTRPLRTSHKPPLWCVVGPSALHAHYELPPDLAAAGEGAIVVDAELEMEAEAGQTERKDMEDEA